MAAAKTLNDIVSEGARSSLNGFITYNPSIPSFAQMSEDIVSLKKKKKTSEDSNIYVGPQPAQSDEVDRILEAVQRVAASYYETEDDEIDVNFIDITSGLTLPLRASIMLPEGLERTIYIKPFDIKRVVGLEFYNVVSGREQLYQFNEGVVVESEVNGVILRPELLDRPGIKTEIAKTFDLARLILLKDLFNDLELEGNDKSVPKPKYDNLIYKSSPDVVVPMDFNVLGAYAGHVKDRIMNFLSECVIGQEMILETHREELATRAFESKDYLTGILSSFERGVNHAKKKFSHNQYLDKLQSISYGMKKNLELASRGEAW